MTRSESKYFVTATKMDEAFLRLLEKKDISYITVKEICETAGVNRSTFYLHYETISDLLSESVNYLNDQFLAYMKKDKEAVVSRLQKCSLNELVPCYTGISHSISWLYKGIQKNISYRNRKCCGIGTGKKL